MGESVAVGRCRRKALIRVTGGESEAAIVFRPDSAILRSIQKKGEDEMQNTQAVDKRIVAYLAMLKMLLSSASEKLGDVADGRIRDARVKGVYIIRDPKTRDVVYVGRNKGAGNATVASRMAEHRGGTSSSDLKQMTARHGQRLDPSSCEVQWIGIEAEEDRIFFEHFLVAVLRPAMNSK